MKPIIDNYLFTTTHDINTLKRHIIMFIALTVNMLLSGLNNIAMEASGCKQLERRQPPRRVEERLMAIAGKATAYNSAEYNSTNDKLAEFQLAECSCSLASNQR